MMEIMLTIVGWVVAAASVFIALALSSASIYEAKALRARMRISRCRLSKASRPHITVLIYNASVAEGITECLRSLNHCRYTNMDIVVVDNHTTLAARRLIRTSLAVASCPTTLYAIRKRVSESTALYQAYKKSQRGGLVVVLSPTSVVDSSLLREVALRRRHLPIKAALKFAVRDDREPQIMTLFAIFVSLSRLTLEKARTVIGYQTTRLQTGYVFPALVFRRKGQTIPSQLDADLCAYQVAQENYAASPRWFRMFRLIVSIGMLLSGLVTINAAVTFVTNTPLVLSCALLGFWLAGVVWLDDRTSLRHKLALSFALPPSYFLLLGFMITRPLIGFTNHYRFLDNTQLAPKHT